MVSDRGAVDPEDDPTYADAADWFARLHDGELSTDDILEWQRLMAANPEFAAAYAGIEEVWNAVGEARRPPLAAPKKAQNDLYDGSVSISRWLTDPPSFAPRRMAANWAASLAGITLLALLIFWERRPPVRVLQTQAGQNQAFILADGSRLHLGASTRIEITLDARARTLNLLRGEAFFAVAKDLNRPFTVHAGSATATAVGTEFSVNRAAGHVSVTVIEGRVLVGSSTAAPKDADRAKLQSQQLDAGEQILVSTDAAVSGKYFGEVTAGIGWHMGRLAFQSEPLSRVLEDVNRYAPKPIVLDDPSIGDFMITGTVLKSDIPGWLASLQMSLPVRIGEDTQRITIRSRRN